MEREQSATPSQYNPSWFWDEHFPSEAKVRWSIFQTRLIKSLKIDPSNIQSEVQLRCLRLLLGEFEAVLEVQQTKKVKSVPPAVPPLAAVPSAIDKLRSPKAVASAAAAATPPKEPQPPSFEIDELELVASLARCEQLTDVPRRAWELLLTYFGPLDTSAGILTTVEKVVTHNVFFGVMSRAGAERRLLESSRVDTSYMFRFSLTRPGHYVLSRRKAQNVTHLLVPYLADKNLYLYQDRAVSLDELCKTFETSQMGYVYSGTARSMYAMKVSTFRADLEAEKQRAKMIERAEVRKPGQQQAVKKQLVRSLLDQCCHCMLSHIGDFDADSLQYIPESVSRVILNYCLNRAAVTNQTLFPFLMPDIKSLSLRSANIAFEKIARSCPNLEELDLTGCFLLTPPEFDAIVTKVRTLKKLKLNGCKWLKQESGDTIARHCKNLEVLDVRETPLGDHLPLNRLPRLTWLATSAFADFSVSKQLTYLEIEDPFGKHMHWLGETMPVSLVTLRITGRVLFLSPARSDVAMTLADINGSSKKEHKTIPTPEFTALLTTCTRLQHIELPLAPTQLPDAQKVVTLFNTSLRHLSLGQASLEPHLPLLLQRLRLLEQLSLQTFELASFGSCGFLSLQGLGLTTGGVHPHHPITHATGVLESLLEHCPNLKWLNLEAFNFPSTVRISHRNLEQVGLPSCQLSFPARLSFADMPRLNLLSLPFVRGVATLHLIQCPQLRALEFDCKTLSECELEKCAVLTDVAVRGTAHGKVTARDCPLLVPRENNIIIIK